MAIGVINKVFIVDDHSIVRQGLKQIIDLEDDMVIVGEAENINSAIQSISSLVPDLVIIDISLDGDASGIDLVKAIKDRFANIKTLVLSMHDESLYAERAIRAGARGYIMKKKAYSDIINAIRTVLDGNLYLSSDVSVRIIDKLVHGASDSSGLPTDQLSDRELEIFQLIGNGFSTSEIAEKLNISINTVQSHKRHLKEKMAFKNSTELMKHAVQWVQSQVK